MNASTRYTSKLDKYTVMDSAFKLDWQKSKVKEYMHGCENNFNVLDGSTLFFDLSCLKHGSSYRG